MRRKTNISISIVSFLFIVQGVFASHLTGTPATYTLDNDFDEGTLVNVNHDNPNNNQLQLNSIATPFHFIWVSISSKGTIVKIDTDTGLVLGEYRTAPSGRGLNPSRTTVDNNGNVWATNRDENGLVLANAIAPGVPTVDRYMGSVLQIGLEENNQCIDKNNNGVIDTSTGLNDIRAWSNIGGTDALGGVSTAEDECIIHYVRVNSTGARHVSVNQNNDVWVSGTGGRHFDLIDSFTGNIISQQTSVGYGGYGGLIDGNGVIWSARPLLRWDTSNPLTGANGDPVGPSIGPPTPGTNWAGQNIDSYGLCINPNNGEVWNTQLNGNTINRYASDGTFIGSYSHGSQSAQGCVVDSNGHIWIAHSLLGSNTVGHLNATGTFLGNITVGSNPTGVAVDANGKIWATNNSSRTVSRIDPSLNGGIGAVDFTSVDLGGNLYNYSDMTGSTLIAPPNEGTWTIIHDSGIAEQEWGMVSWTASQPGNSLLIITAASSDDGITFGPAETVTNNIDLTIANGQYLKVNVSFMRATTGESPILYDLTISTNHPPDCSNAYADPNRLWPPNHKFVPINIKGITDLDDDLLTIAITSVMQDEPVNDFSDGHTVPDAIVQNPGSVNLRSERAGSKKLPGNGRVYHVEFTVDDGYDACWGEVTICVPHDQGQKTTCIDEGPLFNSL